MLSRIEAFLGGAKRLRCRIGSGMDFHRLIREGIPWEAGEFFQKYIQLSDQNFACILGISERTLSRIRKDRKRFPSFASDRLYRLARILSIAQEVLENESRTREWLQRPQWGLGGRVPLDLLETDPGADEVKNILGRIEHGILA